MTPKQAACRHQYWHIYWCLDCGISANDPEYDRQCRERLRIANLDVLARQAVQTFARAPARDVKGFVGGGNWDY